ncbi:hypothetical protein [Massilia sp. Root335]|uniref:hypothetical protein n=1 Tax=Massilia sp. Root335 TaxID=1736517 RepID=UPI000ABD2AA7|nr:hypothetical protein [Massilia sp. Root335]
MNHLPRHGGRMRLLACVTAFATSACSTLMNPYLDTSALNKGPACAQTQTCSATQRFIGIRDAVVTAQEGPRTAYVERAKLNSWSSALAFPLSGLLLYGAATRSSEGARKGILGGGLLMGSAYETRNALMSGSPESTYLLAEARLACVVDEAAKYNLQPAAPACTGKLQAVTQQLAVVRGLNPAADLRPKRDDDVAKAEGAIAQYLQREQRISTAADHMQSAARAILVNTNAQIRTASVSPATATALMKSEMSLFQPVTKLDAGKVVVATGAGETPYPTVAKELNDLSDKLTDFAEACVRPQPQSPAPFDGCVTYSPAAPALPTITTSLAGNQFDMSPGASKTFTVTSAPSGTPWADYGGDPGAANAALGRPQIVTLTPTQSQVTLNYAKAVAKETPITLSLYTIGVAGNALPLTITLKPDAPGKDQDGTAAAAAAPGGSIDPRIVALAATDKCLMKSMQPYPTDAVQLDHMLRVQWNNLKPPGAAPTPEQLTGKAFIQQIKDAAKPPPPECAAK